MSFRSNIGTTRTTRRYYRKNRCIAFSSSSCIPFVLCFLMIFWMKNTPQTSVTSMGIVALGHIGVNGEIDIGDEAGADTTTLSTLESTVGSRRIPPTPPPDTSSSINNGEDEVTSCDCRWGGGEEDAEGVSNSEGARLAYLITVHNKQSIDNAAYLFQSIRHPSTIILLHIDTKVSKDTYLSSALRDEVERCSCGASVHVDSVHNCQWGRWSMNGPTHWAMDVLTSDDRFRGKWDVFINLSGDTMPVYQPSVMSKLFHPSTGPLRNTNFVTSSSCETGLLPTNVHIFPHWWHKWEHYNKNPDGDPVISYIDGNDGDAKEITMVTHFGSQWMALLPDFVEYVAKSLKNPNSLASRYRDFLINARKLMTDETFIPTLLVHAYPYNETLPVLKEDGSLDAMPSMKAIRYERMDEHVPSAFGYFNNQQRYEVPKSSEADEPKVWGPYFLGIYDLGDIVDSGALFIRKVSVNVDPNIVYMFPVSRESDIPYIRWPNELQISEKPNWERIKQEMMKKAKEEEEKKVKEKQ
mmetsp:Transcript_16307/g.23923  ORF Transcript_16307/g.23923 Transcript_16307/m.23923 type:complete len:524 (-) Transcript_16307:499-2070(-)